MAKSNKEKKPNIFSRAAGALFGGLIGAVNGVVAGALSLAAKAASEILDGAAGGTLGLALAAIGGVAAMAVGAVVGAGIGLYEGVKGGIQKGFGKGIRAGLKKPWQGMFEIGSNPSKRTDVSNPDPSHQQKTELKGGDAEPAKKQPDNAKHEAKVQAEQVRLKQQEANARQAGERMVKAQQGIAKQRASQDRKHHNPEATYKSVNSAYIEASMLSRRLSNMVSSYPLSRAEKCYKKREPLPAKLVGKISTGYLDYLVAEASKAKAGLLNVRKELESAITNGVLTAKGVDYFERKIDSEIKSMNELKAFAEYSKTSLQSYKVEKQAEVKQDTSVTMSRRGK